MATKFSRGTGNSALQTGGFAVAAIAIGAAALTWLNFNFLGFVGF